MRAAPRATRTSWLAGSSTTRPGCARSERVASIDLADGIALDTRDIAIAIIREPADYQGVRLTLSADLSSAKLKLRLDLSFGDPVTPEPIDYPTLLDDPGFRLLGYPIALRRLPITQRSPAVTVP